jgi:hypothetical protein
LFAYRSLSQSTALFQLRRCLRLNIGLKLDRADLPRGLQVRY